MSSKRFDVGDAIMCYCSNGWTLGRVIALDYREDNWPSSQPTAPYQVMLEEDDRMLIYVPMDDDQFCRKPTEKDLNIVGRLDALALSSSLGENNYNEKSQRNSNLTTQLISDGVSGYRDGKCECCDSYPPAWTAVELYSEHYRAAARNGLPIIRHKIDLGMVKVGTSLTNIPETQDNFPSSGFLQCPTLPRLPPGVVFEDNGSFSGPVKFDPNRNESYKVEFVAVSTAEWESIGLVRLEITFEVVDNIPPPSFDVEKFEREQESARTKGDRLLESIYQSWGEWESGLLEHSKCIEQLTNALSEMRTLLEEHPCLDQGMWWTELGGYHMNVHKLLENKLFECELYLGQALLVSDARVRRRAEQNLEGCYQKRLLETARYLWYDGLDQIIQGKYSTAIATLDIAAAKKDGWGWGVNHGDIWISAAAAHLLYGAELDANGSFEEAQEQLAKALQLLEKAKTRWNMSGIEHPWAVDIRKALTDQHDSLTQNPFTLTCIDSLKKQTVMWCAQAIQGAYPFPPKTKPRQEDAQALRNRLPGHNK